MKVKMEGTHVPHPSVKGTAPVTRPTEPPLAPVTEVDLHEPGPRPIGTLLVIAILLLVTTAFWMMVLGIQQGRA